MAITIDVNGQTINYPEIGDTNWADEATDFAVQTASAFGKLGLDIGITVDISGTLDVTGNTTLDANLSVGGNASVTGNATITGNLTANGNSNLGNASGDTIAVTGILNVDSGVLYVDPTTNKVGINDATPSVELDVNGAVAITGNETVGGTLNVTGATTLSSTLGVTGDVAINTNKFNITASSGNTTIAGTLGVSGNTTIDGVAYLDDDTTANTPVISFTGDTNTGIGRSAADTLDFITNGASRFRIEPTGQIKAVYESQVGTDYNTQLDNGYLCRAWVNFNGIGTVAIRASGNVTSITDNGTGDYTVNLTTAMPDLNSSIVCINNQFGLNTVTNVARNLSRTNTTSQLHVVSVQGSVLFDGEFNCIAVFR